MIYHSGESNSYLPWFVYFLVSVLFSENKFSQSCIVIKKVGLNQPVAQEKENFMEIDTQSPSKLEQSLNQVMLVLDLQMNLKKQSLTLSLRPVPVAVELVPDPKHQHLGLR